jgi:hypothetical protein
VTDGGRDTVTGKMIVRAELGRRPAWWPLAKYPGRADSWEKRLDRSHGFRGVCRVVVELYGRTLRDDVLILAGSIAYTAILSVFPLAPRINRVL